MIWHKARTRGLLENSIHDARIMMLMRAKAGKDMPGKEKDGGMETDISR